MFCKNCGTELRNGASFCTNCGAKINEFEPSQQNSEGNYYQDQTHLLSQQQQQAPYQAQPQYQNQQQAPYQAQPQYQNQQQNQYQYQNQYQQQRMPGNAGKVSFGEAIKLFFKNYTNFDGRSSVSEYWWIFLFNVLVSLAFSILSTITKGSPLAYLVSGISGLFSLATLIPGLALSVRRLHDVGKAGTYIFMGLIPIVGIFILIAVYLKPSVGDNKWGAGDFQPNNGMNNNNYQM